MRKPTVVSIFSGCGGIDVGFKKAGFNIVFATDHWDVACETMKQNNAAKRVACADIRDVDFQKVLEELNLTSVDCLVGGPPCPAYSKSRFYRKEKKRALSDENAFTLEYYFRALEELRPAVFFFENVHGFVYRPHIEAFKYLEKEATRLGYVIACRVVNAANYGVPQIRERFICVGSRSGLQRFEFPEETHGELGPEGVNLFESPRAPWTNCRQAIGDLDIDMPEDASMQAGSRHKDLLKQVPPGDNYLYFTAKRGFPTPIFRWRSRYWSFLLKLSPDKPSWTIQASHSNNMGPFHWKNRFLRINEIKRLQTFPDKYQILGTYNEQWRQVGNAVPPLLAEAMARQIRQIYFADKRRRDQGGSAPT